MAEVKGEVASPVVEVKKAQDVSKVMEACINGDTTPQETFAALLSQPDNTVVTENDTPFSEPDRVKPAFSSSQENKTRSEMAHSNAESVKKIRELFGLSSVDEVTKKREAEYDEFVSQLETQGSETLNREGGLIDRNTKESSRLKLSDIKDVPHELVVKVLALSGHHNAVRNFRCLSEAGVSIPLSMMYKIGLSIDSIDPDKFNLAVKRLSALGSYLPTDIKTDSTTNFIVSAVNTAGEISEDTFKKIADELSPYTFLHEQRTFQIPPEHTCQNMAAVIDIIKNGGLTETQKKKFEIARRLVLINSPHHLSSDLPFIDTDGHFKNAVISIGQLYQSQIDIDQYAQILFLSQKIAQSKGNFYGFHDWPNVIRVAEAGKLDSVALLFQSGVDITDFIDSYRDTDGDTRLRYDGLLKILANLESEDAFGFLQTFEEIMGKESLSMDRCTLYESLWSERDELLRFATVAGSLPKGLVDMEEAIKHWDIRLGNKAHMSDKCWAYLKNRLCDSETDYIDGKTPYIKNLKDALAHLDITEDKNRQIILYLTQNKDKLADLYNSGLTPDFYNELLSGNTGLPVSVAGELNRIRYFPVEKIDPSLFVKHMHLFDTSEIVNWYKYFAMKNPDLIKIYGSKISSIAEFLHGKQDVFNYIQYYQGSFYELFSDYGQPTEKLLSLLLRSEYSDFRQLLTDDLIESLNEESREVWRFIKESSETVFQSLRSFEGDVRDLVANGKPTQAMISHFLHGAHVDSLKSMLTPEVIAVLSPKYQEFFQVYVSLPSSACYRLSRFEGDLQALFTGGQPTGILLEYLFSCNDTAAIKDVLNQCGHGNFTDNEIKAWLFMVNTDRQSVARFIHQNKDAIDDYVNSNQLTNRFYLDFSRQNPSEFIELAGKENWKIVLGKEVYDSLVTSLPKSSDEKRNAFTHNQYDRTTEFMRFMFSTLKKDFQLTPDNMTTVAKYIREFGLSKTPQLYLVFKTISDFSEGRTSELPQEIRDLNIKNIEDLKTRISHLEGIVYGDQVVRLPDKISDFEIEILDYLTKKSTHTFSSTPTDIIIADYKGDLETGVISPLPQEYTPIDIKISETKVEVEQKKDEIFDLVRSEILESLTDPADTTKLQRELSQILSTKKADFEHTLHSQDGKDDKKLSEQGKKVIQKQIDDVSDMLRTIESPMNIDQLVGMLLDVNFGKKSSEQGKISSILRQLVFRKFFINQSSNEGLDELVSQIDSGMDARAILALRNFLKEPIKEHVLNIQNDNAENYWETGVYQKIKDKKGVKTSYLLELINPYYQHLVEMIDSFEIKDTGSDTQVRVVPDRGIIGEMSGYLAHACYTRVRPLLKSYPNVIPFKFMEKKGGEMQLIGSTLVFEIEDEKGNPAMLIRAFNIPQEEKIDIGHFFESFSDQLMSTARQRGFKKILVAGTSGTTSNYGMTNRYVSERYVDGKGNVPLSKPFDFNGYDITDQCYLVREV